MTNETRFNIQTICPHCTHKISINFKKDTLLIKEKGEAVNRDAPLIIPSHLMEVDIEDLFINGRIFNALFYKGKKKLKDLHGMKYVEFMMLKNLGMKSWHDLKFAIKKIS